MNNFLPEFKPGMGISGAFNKVHTIGWLGNLLSPQYDGAIIRLRPGDYIFPAQAAPTMMSIAIIAEDPGTVVLRMDSDRASGPVVNMIGETQGFLNFYLYGIVLDGWWDKADLIKSRFRDNIKFNLCFPRAWRGKLEKCKFRNFGAIGKDENGIYNEAFNGLRTWVGGPPSQALESIPQIEIVDCVVEDGHFEKGGYSTGLIVETSQPGAGDRFEFGLRTTKAAWVHRNRVNLPGGIAYGMANAENVLFEDNRAESCMCAFNWDTGNAKNIHIRDNTFLKCNTGLNLTGLGGGIELTGNTVEITKKPFRNTVLNRDEPQFFVKASRDVFSNNNLYVSHGPTDGLFEKCVPGAHDRVVLPGSSSTSEIEDLKGQIKELNKNLESCEKELGVSDLRNELLRGKLDEVKQAVGVLTKLNDA